VFSASSRSYADALKKQFSLVLTAAHSTTDHTRPPRKRQAVIIDYNLDQLSSAANPSTPADKKSPSPYDHHSNSPTATTTTTDYANGLLSIKKEISDLKTLITTVVEQFTTAIKSLHATSSSPSPSNDMDTEVNQPTAPHNPTPNSPDLSAIINELKHKLATFVIKMRALFQQEKHVFIPFQLSPMLPSVAMLSQCGSS